MSNKIIRSICLFTDQPEVSQQERLDSFANKLSDNGFLVQTRRIVSKNTSIADLDRIFKGKELFIGAGSLSREEIRTQIQDFYQSDNISFNLEIADEVHVDDVQLLFDIIKTKPEKTFNIYYTFSNVFSSAFFPAANFEKNGFSIGLQPTDLAENAVDLDTWFSRMKEVWEEIIGIFANQPDFLGIDSSIAPMYSGKGSLVNLMKRIHGGFSESVTTDSYTRISAFIKNENPKPIGLCGLMFPCLEDFELSDEYEAGNFSIERNIFLSLHSGLGIDTYPIGIDENPERVKQILNLLLALAHKYNKPLSARFVSDGKSRIGEFSDFRNPYLRDVVLKPL